jgi:hypothetical protein
MVDQEDKLRNNVDYEQLSRAALIRLLQRVENSLSWIWDAARVLPLLTSKPLAGK